MGNYKFELNTAGIGELLKSPEMQKVVEDYAKRLVEFAGDEYEAETKTGKTRVKCTVRAATPHAFYSNRKHNTLLKGLGAIRK